MKRRWRERTERIAAEVFEVPKDTLEHVPRITVIGDVQLIAENYLSIIEFAGDLIRISLTKGQIAIRGENLVIKTIVPEQLVVEGVISGIDFQ